MHLLASDFVTLDDTAQAVDLGHGPADYVFLSFSDADIAAFASAWAGGPHRAARLRIANIARLQHPYSVDLYIEKTLSHARLIFIRLLGGLDYWRYGVEEIAALARAKGIELILIPGDYQADPRLDAASTRDAQTLRRYWQYFQEGGPENMAALQARLCAQPAPEPVTTPPFGHFHAACHRGEAAAPHALLLFYRSHYLADDTAPVLALAQGLAARGFSVAACYITSLKDGAATRLLACEIAAHPPEIILNTTAFAARDTHGAAFVLDACDAPVMQVVLAGTSAAQWQASPRGLNANDLAMNIVLPELDGRIHAGAISFKDETMLDAALGLTRTIHQPDAALVAQVVARAAALVRLRQTPRAQRKIALILSDYPGKAGRTAYAVGLDTPQSAVDIAQHLREAGYAITPLPEPARLMAELAAGQHRHAISLAEYESLLAQLPQALRQAISTRWGEPHTDAAFKNGAFHFSMVKAGHLLLAVQPGRGDATQDGLYHDLATPPCHAYVAFYLWLRAEFAMHAMLHCGTHGTLEWLPGKAMALSPACAPQALIGPVPVIYPFIVNNPGEAAQAKRRIGALTLGHMTPPLMPAGHHGEAIEIEAMLEEYAQAQSLDRRRADWLAQAILARASAAGLMDAADAQANPSDQLQKLDAWLCEVKEMRIGDGLHIFGAAPYQSEMAGLVQALDGRFVPPGPAGAPEQGRSDVLPTGRNLYACDPRAIPTRTAWEIGQRTASALTARYAQEHGQWPQHIFLDLWGSASLRTGGDDLAQAFALLGVRPTWDSASTRVNGFEILPLARLEHARVAVTLRISGLFRDMFAAQIVLFDAAVAAVSALDESVADNPLKTRIGEAAVFGPAPQSYGLSLVRALAESPMADQHGLGDRYIRENAFAYGRELDGIPARAPLERAIASADAFIHVQDMAGQDVLDSDAFAQSEGGFAAAAASLGRAPAIYHADTSQGRSAIRTINEELARVLQARATNPRWLAGQMRHGHRGAAEIANSVENLFAYAALTHAVPSRHFERLFASLCEASDVREFLLKANPQAAQAISRCFSHALARGFWRDRRNSIAAILSAMEGQP
ncbi:MAG: cobaltochelatase subunit CobN [Hyphomicrobiales bacterium]|nr:cobaltochelatase subunit CobN [Hyphomicrobiales bacterium]MDE2114719.1 cobaltochelatase subunit CobN [Hyphomicrobiales bacterium]